MGTIDLNGLPTFLAVADAGSFSAAATKLRLPKSSVSRHVAALERDLGVQLFHRTTRRVSLSTAGRALRDQVAPSLTALLASVSTVPELEPEPSGLLRITAAADISTALLAELIAQFTIRYPGIEVELHVTNEMVDLVGDGFDIAVRIAMRQLRDSNLVARRAAPIELGLYASPAYLARRGVPKAPSDLPGQRWIAFREPLPLRLVGPDGSVTIRVAPTIRCDDMFFVRESIRHGAALGALPTFLAHPDVLAGALVPVLPRWSIPTGALWIVRHGGTRVPRKVVAFEEFLLASLRARQPG